MIGKGASLDESLYVIKVDSSRLVLPDGCTFRCAVGRSGIVENKTEGDGGTPTGTLPLKQVLYRPDRVVKPTTKLPVRTMTPVDIWIDDPNHPSYNSHALLPINNEISHETLWQDNHCYDVVVTLGYNDDPPVFNKGSAIFLHVAHGDYGATAGCISLSMKDLLDVLASVGSNSCLEVSTIN